LQTTGAVLPAVARSRGHAVWAGLIRRIALERNSYLLVLPILALYGVFSIYPIVQTIQLSFFDARILGNSPFVGLANYIALIRDPVFVQTLRNTLFFTFVSIPLTLSLALLLAVLLNLEWVRFKVFFKVVYFMPVVTSTVAIGYIWKWIYNPGTGILNMMLAAFHLPAPGWLVDPHVALAALIAVNVWSWTGYFMVIFLANLQIIDPAYYEAAEIDGAGSFQQFAFVTLPFLRVAFVINLILATVHFLRTFALVLVMTRGGPANATELVTTYVYRQAFGTGFFKFGFSAAGSVVLFILIMVFSAAFTRLTPAEEGL
jgi:ABC-type sugar transport system permease subunit